jgi:hypothetical protein
VIEVEPLEERANKADNQHHREHRSGCGGMGEQAKVSFTQSVPPMGEGWLRQ